MYNHKDIIYEDVVYKPTHLNTFSFDVARSDDAHNDSWAVPIDVVFSWHCYTRASRGEEEEDVVHARGNERRCFCPVRFEQSQALPDIIKDLSERKVFQTGKGNFITIEIVDDNGDRAEYEVYFSLRKKGKREALKLFVESAYIYDEARSKFRQKSKRQAIRFRVLVYNIKHDKPVRFKK